MFYLDQLMRLDPFEFSIFSASVTYGSQKGLVRIMQYETEYSLWMTM